jgi:hypothetical protein
MKYLDRILEVGRVSQMMWTCTLKNATIAFELRVMV